MNLSSLPTKEIRDDKTWAKGDFALVSVDGVRFRVDGCYLMAASTVFRAMIEAGDGEREVYLVDPDVEHGAIISLFLWLITAVELRTESLTASKIPPLKGILSLLAFCDKFECDVARKTALVLLQLSACGLAPLDGFVVGAANDIANTCRNALQSASTDFSAMTTLNPRNIPLDTFKLIPHTYLWALERAWKQKEAQDMVQSGYVPMKRHSTFSPYKLTLAQMFDNSLKEAKATESAQAKDRAMNTTTTGPDTAPPAKRART